MNNNILKEKPLVIIGKKGLHESVINEIIRLVKERKIIKIKILKNILRGTNLNRKEFFKILQEKLKGYGIKIIDIRGYTAILKYANNRNIQK